MKTGRVSLLVAALAVPLAPLWAASPFEGERDGRTQVGAFAGARFQLALGGPERGRPRVGLTLATTQQERFSDGRQKLRFSEGLELGFTQGEPLAARLAGNRLTGGSKMGTNDPRLGVSTIGAAGIAAGAIVAGLVIYALAVRGDADD